MPSPKQNKTGLKRETVRILIVDDEYAFHELIPLLLGSEESAKIEPCHAFNPQEVFEILEECPIDCIFMDLVLPKKNGMEIAELVRKIYRLRQPYIVGMTSFTGGREREKCLSHGMNDFMRKPIDPEKLSTLFQKFLDWRRNCKKTGLGRELPRRD